MQSEQTININFKTYNKLIYFHAGQWQIIFLRGGTFHGTKTPKNFNAGKDCANYSILKKWKDLSSPDHQTFPCPCYP